MLQSKLETVKTSVDTTNSDLAGTCYHIVLSTSLHNEWIIDSGASIHICFAKPFFQLSDLIKTSVVLPNDSKFFSLIIVKFRKDPL